MNISIYAIKVRGRVLYVGHTCNMRRRRKALFAKSGKGFPHGAEMFELRKTNELDANRIEHQIIRAFKGKGEAEFNVNLRRTGARSPGYSENQIICLETGEKFASYAACGRRFGLGVQTLKKHILAGEPIRGNEQTREGDGWSIHTWTTYTLITKPNL